VVGDEDNEQPAVLIVRIWTSWYGGIETCIGNVDPMIPQGYPLCRNGK
jgi:hypothetical protein